MVPGEPQGTWVPWESNIFGFLIFQTNVCNMDKGNQFEAVVRYGNLRQNFCF